MESIPMDGSINEMFAAISQQFKDTPLTLSIEQRAKLRLMRDIADYVTSGDQFGDLNEFAQELEIVRQASSGDAKTSLYLNAMVPFPYSEERLDARTAALKKLAPIVERQAAVLQKTAITAMFGNYSFDLEDLDKVSVAVRILTKAKEHKAQFLFDENADYTKLASAMETEPLLLASIFDQIAPKKTTVQKQKAESVKTNARRTTKSAADGDSDSEEDSDYVPDEEDEPETDYNEAITVEEIQDMITGLWDYISQQPAEPVQPEPVQPENVQQQLFDPEAFKKEVIEAAREGGKQAADERAQGELKNKIAAFFDVFFGLHMRLGIVQMISDYLETHLSVQTLEAIGAGLRGGATFGAVQWNVRRRKKLELPANNVFQMFASLPEQGLGRTALMWKVASFFTGLPFVLELSSPAIQVAGKAVAAPAFLFSLGYSGLVTNAVGIPVMTALSIDKTGFLTIIALYFYMGWFWRRARAAGWEGIPFLILKILFDLQG